MAYREMSFEDIQARIEKGDFVVYVEEEYGYRYWFWFPDMSEEELLAYWEKCNIEDHFFNPSGLPGDMVPLPENPKCVGMSDEEAEEYYNRAYADPRSGGLLSRRFQDADDDTKAQMIEDYDAYIAEWFPGEAMWQKGWRDRCGSWRAHTHMEDDSFLTPPKKESEDDTATGT